MADFWLEHCKEFVIDRILEQRPVTEKWTPGPWLSTKATVYALNSDGVNHISLHIQSLKAPTSEIHANAHLISAAPDMAAALSAIVDHSEKGLGILDDSHVDAAKVALAKARGT